MRKTKLLCVALATAMCLCGCNKGVSQSEYESLLAEKNSLQAELETQAETTKAVEAETKATEKQTETTTVAETVRETEKETSKYNLEGETIQTSVASYPADKAEYNTGITYEQLARQPETYDTDLVTFTGEVLQTMEVDSERMLMRLAVDGDYDEILGVVYQKSVPKQRILDGDTITIYGVSLQLYTYTTVMNSEVTIPLVGALMIDEQGSSVSVDTSTTSGGTSTASENLNELVEVVGSYTLKRSRYSMRYLIVKNNSSQTVKVSVSEIAYDSNGNAVSVSDGSQQALGAGCTSIITGYFDTSERIDHVDTTISANKDKSYNSIIQDLTYSQTNINKGAIFQITNNGAVAADFVEGYALFFKGGELVYVDETYFVDDDNKIQPGATISKQLTSYEDFDSIEFYMTGRARK